MPRLTFAAWLLLSVTVWAAPQVPLPMPPGPPQPPTPVPAEPMVESSSTTTPDNTRYLNDPVILSDCQLRVTAFKGNPCKMIFIGDSITAFWAYSGSAIWEKYYGDRYPLNFGLHGDRLQNVLWRLENVDLKGIRPKVAVILTGSNNDDSPQEIADGVKAIVAKTREVFPGAKIILVSLMPNARANDKMMQADAIIKTFSDNRTVFYLDLVPLMPPVGNNWKGLGPDRMHPDQTGYEIWAKAMEPLVKKFLGGLDFE